jgi:hypothetical protein
MDNIVNIRYKRHNSDSSAKKEKESNAACMLLYPIFNALEYIDDEKLLEMMDF